MYNCMILKWILIKCAKLIEAISIEKQNTYITINN